jgi:hypothetical protein
MQLNLTFDLDFTDYQRGCYVDEALYHLKPILRVLDELGVTDATWFVRVDSDIAALHGSRRAFTNELSRVVGLIRSHGHSVGWHHHSSEHSRSDEREIRDEILTFGEIARSFDLNYFRAGFGQMTNVIMGLLSELGISIDSSCISRPQYPWETIPFRNWEFAPNRPYVPCRDDYRRDCTSGTLWIQEVPMTTVVLPRATDSQSGVRRYLNPAYNPELFYAGIESFRASDDHNVQLVTVTHPYETSVTESRTFSGNLDSFRDNIQLLFESGFIHVSISNLELHPH